MKRQKPSETVPFNPTLPKLKKLLKKTKIVVFGNCRGKKKFFKADCTENFSITLDFLYVNLGSPEFPAWQESKGSSGYTLHGLDASTLDWVEDLSDGTVTATRVTSKGKMKTTLVYAFITDSKSAAKFE